MHPSRSSGSSPDPFGARRRRARDVVRKAFLGADFAAETTSKERVWQRLMTEHIIPAGGGGPGDNLVVCGTHHLAETTMIDGARVRIVDLERLPDERVARVAETALAAVGVTQARM